MDELWSLGDMVGRGPDPEHVVARTRECCRVALLGNHDYDALRATEPPRFVRSFALARERLDEDAIAWMRSRRPAATRRRRPVLARRPAQPGARVRRRGNAAACLEKQRAPLGLVGHTHVPAAFHERTRRVRITPGEPLDISEGKWLLNPGAVGAPRLTARLVGRARRPGRGCWLLLDLDARTATWMAAPFDPAPPGARELGSQARVRAMSTQVVVARLAGLTGRAAELRQLLADRARDVRAEDGCVELRGRRAARRAGGVPDRADVDVERDDARALLHRGPRRLPARGRRAARHAVGGRAARGRVDDAPEREHVADRSWTLRLALI